jgi:hypothetical protein
MLQSQLSSIFDNFRQEIGVFQNFALFSFVFGQNRQFFANLFGRNIFKIIT